MTHSPSADPALVPPTLNTSPLPEYDYDRLDYGMTIGIERTPGGRIWACWVGGGDNEKAFFVLATSDDNGESWSKPRLVIDPHDPSLPQARRTIVGNLWTDPRGRLWLFFDQALTHFDARAGLWVTVCENPDAQEPVWSAPRRLWHGCALNKPVVLANGEWLLPVSLWEMSQSHPHFKSHPELDADRGANVFVSSDEGATWSRRGHVRFPNPCFDEHHIIERRDGSLWMTARTNASIWESVSRDHGRTWSEPNRSAIEHISSRHFLRRLRSGRLLLVKHGVAVDRLPPAYGGTHPRSHLTAFLSDDDGQSWQGGLVLDKRRNVSYPDGFEAPDGTLFISYDWERDLEGEILLARFTEADVLAGTLVSPGSRLRRRISKPLGLAARTRSFHVYKGFPPIHCCCDSTWRRLPNGDQAIFFLTGGRHEPEPGNFVAMCRSEDEGETWSAPQCIVRNDPNPMPPQPTVTLNYASPHGPYSLSSWAVTLSEVVVHEGIITVYLQVHHGRFDHWQTATISSADNGQTWSEPVPFEPLPRRSMIRNLYRTSWGEWLLPYQYYAPTGDWRRSSREDGSFETPWNGVLIGPSPNGPWTDCQPIQGAWGWSEVNVVELRDGRLVMLSRTDYADGTAPHELLRTESTDRGRTWSPFRRSGIPNPGSKFRLFRLSDGRILLLHNPSPQLGVRNPLALWISDDDMETWSVKKLVTDFPGPLQYPDGEVSADERTLHFAFDYNRHDVLYWQMEIPQ